MDVVNEGPALCATAKAAQAREGKNDVNMVTPRAEYRKDGDVKELDHRMDMFHEALK